MEKRRETVAMVVPPLPFEVQYDALLDAYYSMDAHIEDEGVAVSRAQRKLELQSQMAQLSVAHGELRRALDHYDAIYKWILNNKRPEEEQEDETDSSEAPAAETDKKDEADQTQQINPHMSDEIALSLRAVLPELLINALANMSAIHHRLGDTKSATARLLTAKQAMRELREASAEADTMHDRMDSLQRLEAALAVNYTVLLQSQGSVDDAVLAAEAALRLTGPVPEEKKSNAQQEDATMAMARQVATEVLVSSYRIKGDTSRVRAISSQVDEGLNALSQDSDSHVLVRSHNNAALFCFENRAFAAALRHCLSAYRILLTSKPSDTKLRTIVTYHIGRTLMELGTTTTLPASDSPVNAQQCLALEEPILPDALVSVVVQASLGELAYGDGDFALATSRLLNALADLQRITEIDKTQLHAPSKQDVVHIQGFIESFLGNALLADGKVHEAELAHQRDLELALDSEDLDAQLRAIHNLAVLYRVTQRHAEAVPLWHETIDIATVLASKRDLIIAYGGLGTTLHELNIIDSGKGEYQELLAERDHNPRAIFLKQRTLALELGDLESQVLAQKQIVRTYEWPSQPNELEHRLEACDSLVQLSEQLGQATHCADAYRALANAITAQVARLAARGQRFAEAIHVLTVKRNAVLQKFRDATTVASKSTIAPLQRRESFGGVTILQRALV